MADRRIDIGELDLAVAEVGEGGRPLLLLPGFTGAKEDFADWFEPLAAEGWHVVSPDNRGHGESGKPEGESRYSLEIFAADTLALVDALGWDTFTVLGHSMGGMFVQLVARKVPDRVSALILMDTCAGLVEGLDPELVDLAISVARSEGMDAVADTLSSMDDAPLDTQARLELYDRRPEIRELSDRNTRVCSPDMYAAMAAELVHGAEDRLVWLDELIMPTLVLVGADDQIFLQPSRAMAARLPDARLVVLSGGGHSPQQEAPEAWWAAMSDFLKEAS